MHAGDQVERERKATMQVQPLYMDELEFPMEEEEQYELDCLDEEYELKCLIEATRTIYDPSKDAELVIYDKDAEVVCSAQPPHALSLSPTMSASLPLLFLPLGEADHGARDIEAIEHGRQHGQGGAGATRAAASLDDRGGRASRGDPSCALAG